VFACQRRQRLAIIPLAFLLGAQAAHAANCFINTASGGGAFPAGIGSGNSGNLRWCIAQANANPGSTITNAVNAPILLGKHLPVISAAVTIQGGSGITNIIDGQNAWRIFFVDAPANRDGHDQRVSSPRPPYVSPVTSALRAIISTKDRAPNK
jgi:hypothetical protein